MHIVQSYYSQKKKWSKGKVKDKAQNAVSVSQETYDK